MLATRRDGSVMSLRIGDAVAGNLFATLTLDHRDMDLLDFTDPKILLWWQNLACKFPPSRKEFGMVYVYSFVAWPDETWREFPKELFDLFRMYCRVEFQLTEQQFDIFRAKLAAVGVTLREVERVLYREPESVV